MNTEIQEPIQKVEEIKPTQNNVKVDVVLEQKAKKPRKPLSQESIKKRADVLIRAREAKKLKSVNGKVDKPTPLKIKTEDDLKQLVEPVLSKLIETKKANKPPKEIAVKTEVDLEPIVNKIIETKKANKPPKQKVVKTEQEIIQKRINQIKQLETIVEEKIKQLKEDKKHKSLSLKNLF